jgi:hypothetical protein
MARSYQQGQNVSGVPWTRPRISEVGTTAARRAAETEAGRPAGGRYAFTWQLVPPFTIC